MNNHLTNTRAMTPRVMTPGVMTGRVAAGPVDVGGRLEDDATVADRAGTDAAGVAWSYAGTVPVSQRWWQAAWPLLAVTGPGAAALGVWAATGNPVAMVETGVTAAVAAVTVDHLAGVTARDNRADRDDRHRQWRCIGAAAVAGTGLVALGTLSPAVTAVLGGAALIVVLREQWKPSTSPTSPISPISPTEPAGPAGPSGRADQPGDGESSGPAGGWGWSCPSCAVDSAPAESAGEAAELAGVHDGLHHGTRSTAWLWAAPTGTGTGTGVTGGTAARSGWAA